MLVSLSKKASMSAFQRVYSLNVFAACGERERGKIFGEEKNRWGLGKWGKEMAGSLRVEPKV